MYNIKLIVLYQSSQTRLIGFVDKKKLFHRLMGLRRRGGCDDVASYKISQCNRRCLAQPFLFAGRSVLQLGPKTHTLKTFNSIEI